MNTVIVDVAEKIEQTKVDERKRQRLGWYIFFVALGFVCLVVIIVILARRYRRNLNLAKLGYESLIDKMVAEDADLDDPFYDPDEDYNEDIDEFSELPTSEEVARAQQILDDADHEAHRRERKLSYRKKVH